ncbi:hypothetical protein V5O48_018088 [Marasmius crinis-equi]|uniref:Uncharacterized protein n=1 Tax=Marasmius crinis-equi TaxID=585013 RepID=A0ABR3EM45_9AGAR
MKFTVLPFVLAAALSGVRGQGNANFGIISPADGTSINKDGALNVTFNPGRYARESTSSIDVFIIDDHLQPKSGKNGIQVVTAMKPNTKVTQIEGGSPETDAYTVEVQFNQLAAPVPGDRTVLVVESYNAFGGGAATAYWTQTFGVTA